MLIITVIGLSLLLISTIYYITNLISKNEIDKAKQKWKKNPRIHLDEYIKNYNDQLKKEIDGEHYIEGKYWILEVLTDGPDWYCCSLNKSVIRFAARLFIKKHYYRCTIYSSNVEYGKLLLDHSHAKRFVKTKNVKYHFPD